MVIPGVALVGCGDHDDASTGAEEASGASATSTGVTSATSSSTSVDTGPGGNDGAGSDSTDGALDPRASIDACLQAIGATLGCSGLGSTVQAFAFDQPVGGRDAVCGDFGALVNPLQLTFVIGTDPADLTVHGIRLRSDPWATPLFGDWWEFLPAQPIAIDASNPLPAELSGWTAHIISYPPGLGWLLQEGLTDNVELSFGAPVTDSDILDGEPVQLTVALRGGRYLRVDVGAGERTFVDDVSALGLACVHLAASIAISDDQETVTCGPDFDTCPEGFQRCAVSQDDSQFICRPDLRCEPECDFVCGTVGGGECAPPWQPAM